MERKREVEPSGRPPKRLPRIVLPPYRPPTPEQLERRRVLGEESRKLRKEIGPLGFSLTDLIREDREAH